MRRVLASLAAVAVCIAFIAAAWNPVRNLLAEEGPEWNEGLPQQYNSIWKVHDIFRPKPPQVAPADAPGAPPADAVVLFDGKDLSKWNGKWKVQDDYMECNSTGSISTKDSFGDCQLHLEYMAPSPAFLNTSSQARGNSGILFMGHYEVQVLDNCENATYSDGYIGGVYGQHPPLVNPCRKPGEWQTYDIVFRAPRFKGKTDEVAEPGRFTVFLNGVLVQHDAEIYGRVRWRGLATYAYHEEARPLVLQDHGDKQPVRFRNIWIRKLDLSWEAIDNRKK
jgi:hypothetical protein